MRSGFRWYDSIFILLFFYLLVLQIQAIWPFTVDDMYISLRYARNWAAGDGLLWNVNSPPVEGYSNFIFVVLGALSVLLKLNPIIVLKIAGFVGLLSTCLFLYFISRFWFSKRESLIPSIILLLYKGQIIWAVSGFETTVYQALICGAVYFIFRGLGYGIYPELRDKPKLGFFFSAGLFLSIAGLTRPEAPALMVLFFVLMCWDRPKIWIKEYRKGILHFLVAILVFYIPYFLWRWSYYGFLFPNSVYCKAFSDAYTFELDINYLKLSWPFFILAIPACIKAPDKRHYFLWLPSIVYLLMLKDADTVVAFDNRLFLSAFALLIPLTLLGLAEIVLFCIKKNRRYFTLVLSLVSFVLVGLFVPWMTLAQYRYFSENPVRGEQLRMSVLHWLSVKAKANDKVVLSDSGMIPYFSNLHYIDSYCLNNVSMAHYPEKQRYEQFCHGILDEKPNIIILTSLIKNGHVIYTPSDSCLKVLLNNQTGYKLNSSFSVVNPDSVYQYEMFTDF